MNLDEILLTASQLDANGGVEDIMNENSSLPYNPDVFTLGKGEDLDQYLQEFTNRSSNNMMDQLGLDETKGKTDYNLDANMEFQRKLYEGKAEMTSSAKNVPNAILESIRNNPLNLNPNLVTQDDNIDLLGERAQEKMARFSKLTEQLEQKDREKNSARQTETAPTMQSASSIDYALIKTIVKECLAEERKSNKCGIMLTTEDGFKFRDAEDNIFECTMRYVGKAKKKK